MLRAVLYPWVAAVVPLLWWRFARERPYPWLADLFVTLVGFTDILGNRLDLYDAVAWFDDWAHFFNGAVAVSAALLLTTHRDTAFVLMLERALALGLTMHTGTERRRGANLPLSRTGPARPRAGWHDRGTDEERGSPCSSSRARSPS